MQFLELTGVVAPDLGGIDRNITGMHVSVTSSGVFLYGTSGINGGLISYQVTEGQIAVLEDSVIYDETITIFAASDLSILEMNGVQYAVTGLDASGNLIAYSFQEDGSVPTPVVLPGAGASAEFAASGEGAGPVTYFYSVSADGDAINVFEVGSVISAHPGLTVPVSDRHHGLVHPQGADLAHLEHAGG